MIYREMGKFGRKKLWSML